MQKTIKSIKIKEPLKLNLHTTQHCPVCLAPEFYDHFFPLAPSQEGTSGKTALHLAVELHDITSVKFLLSRGANVDTAMFNGCTPLHLAVGRQDTTIANLLCQSGADTMLRNMEDETALDLADGNDDVSFFVDVLNTVGSPFFFFCFQGLFDCKVSHGKTFAKTMGYSV